MSILTQREDKILKYSS